MRWQLLLAAVMLRAVHSTLAQSSNNLYAVATRKWVEGFVVAKKLCPWAAAAAASEETMRVTVLPGAFDTPRASLALTSAVLAEAKSLAAPANAGKTTLIVLPHASLALSFAAYLDASAAVEALLTSSRLDASIQLATFHPLYQFAGTRPDSPENFTNRSPYPVLHLLRVADVEGAIRTYTRLKGPTDAIWEANIAHMKKEGGPALAALLAQIKRDSRREWERERGGEGGDEEKDKGE